LNQRFATGCHDGSGRCDAGFDADDFGEAGVFVGSPAAGVFFRRR
jgi:hypothetical protein